MHKKIKKGILKKNNLIRMEIRRNHIKVNPIQMKIIMKFKTRFLVIIMNNINSKIVIIKAKTKKKKYFDFFI